MRSKESVESRDLFGELAWSLKGGLTEEPVEFAYAEREPAFVPVSGVCPPAEAASLPEEVQLVYIDVTFRELEPYEGEFAFEEIEEKNQMERWAAEGKHAVFRFVMDVPGEESHIDIPDWLYTATGKDGLWYDIPYGQGYAPDYTNPLLIEAHEEAVEAMAERWGGSSFISYIELGSLGHWGEWHTDWEEGVPRIPEEEIRRQYVEAWTGDRFPHVRFMMRRPFSEARTWHMGLYNDQTGDAEATERFFSWMDEGGDYDQTGEKTAIVPMPDAWKEAPVGGELAGGIDLSDEEELAQTAELMRSSHMTFLGPSAPLPDDAGFEELQKALGCRLSVQSLRWFAESGRIVFVLANTGNAPFYFDWPVCLALIDRETGEVSQTWRTRVELTKLKPGETMTVGSWLPETAEGRPEQALLAIGILDPMLGRPVMPLASDCEYLDGWNMLMPLETGGSEE